MSENKTQTSAAKKETPENKAQGTQKTETPKSTAAGKKAEDAKIKAAQGETSYLPEEKERGLFHVKLDKPAFDQKSGKKLSKAFIQKFTIAEWKQFEKNSKGLGYTCEVLWNPELYK